MRQKGVSMRVSIVGLAALLAACVGLVPSAWAQRQYSIDQHYGGIEFTVKDMGMFTSHGVFDRFMGRLIIDPQHPEHTQIDVQVEAGSVSMPWDQGAELLRSPDFFDASHYPEIRFESTAVQALGPEHYRILGQLQIKGVSQAQTLDAVLVDRHLDAARGSDVADFVVSGELKRSAFGMVADPVVISDTVSLRIHARIALDFPGFN
jgi:polyisoprenoid-binding protein YceI